MHSKNDPPRKLLLNLNTLGLEGVGIEALSQQKLPQNVAVEVGTREAGDSFLLVLRVKGGSKRQCNNRGKHSNLVQLLISIFPIGVEFGIPLVLRVVNVHGFSNLVLLLVLSKESVV